MQVCILVNWKSTGPDDNHSINIKDSNEEGINHPHQTKPNQTKPNLTLKPFLRIHQIQAIAGTPQPDLSVRPRTMGSTLILLLAWNFGLREVLSLNAT
jgi:hypothetical protein